VDPVGNHNRAPGFVDLSPPMGAPLDETGTAVTPTPPAGWTWYEIAGAVCRDGSPTGFYRHRGTADKLMIYLEGGGACSNDRFCAFNPANVNQVMFGNGETLIGSALGAVAGRQQPGVYTSGTPAGIFDTTNSSNPFKDWDQIYIPYCTGDVFFGTNDKGMVPNRTTVQQFLGYRDMQKFIGRIVPTYKNKVSRVVLTGASAGGFGAALNFSMVSDAFGDVPVDVIDDSGPPFDDKYMPVCMQNLWRKAWGFSASLPPDCSECRQADGGGLVRLSDFLLRKHPHASISIISSMQDEVIRLFYSSGLKNCSNYDAADPVAITLGQGDTTVYFQPQPYIDGLTDLRTRYMSSGKLATYYIAGPSPTLHQHIFRTRFFDSTAGNPSMAQFVANTLDGKMAQIGP
jgi:Pectinacetylesterase